MQAKRANLLPGYGPRGAPGATGVRVPPDARPGARDAGRGVRVSPRPRDVDPHPRLLATQPLRGLPRGAVRARQARLRPMAANEVGLELRAAAAARCLRAEDPSSPQNALRERGDRAG